MTELWNNLYSWACSAGAAPCWAKLAASGISSALTVALALSLCLALSAIARRTIDKKSDSNRHREKTHSLVRASSWFVFSWILSAWLPAAMNLPPAATENVSRALDVAAIILLAAALSSALTYLRRMLNSRSWGSNAFASKTLSQTVKILIWFTAAIIAVSTLMGKSPTFVLSGLGALTAVLMLIFRDSLLGLVAGIQVSQNDMVRLGDWITMGKYNADGTVIDIALTTVKVRNFDNTVTMIPSSALISDAFINWRYMSLSKGRRIKRPIWINAMTIRELSASDRDSLVAQGLLAAEDRPVSNLAAFEIWLRRMLAADDTITKELTCMVRQTAAGDTGIPVEVYAFTKTRDWEEYEKIQTEIFDRIYVTLPKFALQIYQRTGDKPSITL
jgi:miniconductance mechanosensitive channel